jgi:hypothetical protein
MSSDPSTFGSLPVQSLHFKFDFESEYLELGFHSSLRTLIYFFTAQRDGHRSDPGYSTNQLFGKVNSISMYVPTSGDCVVTRLGEF